VFVLMIVGMILSAGVLRLQRWLLRWRPAQGQQV
jgi:ABC-type nitrate/sulfonate/bicarbonate transport system permease component